MAGQPYHHGEPGATAFHPGLPDVGQFPFNTWSRLLTRRAKAARSDLFGTYYVTGYPDLREAIARYLTASRGVVCTPDQVVVTNGAQSAFDLMARLLLDPGDTVWMEEPGYYGAAAALLCLPVRGSRPLHVGEAGWDLTPPPGPPPRAIFVTPSCHHPLGLTMSMGQRLELLRLVRAVGRLADRGRLRQRIPLSGSADPGAARRVLGRADDLRRYLRQDTVSGHAARLRRAAAGALAAGQGRAQRNGPFRAAADAGGAGGFRGRGAFRPPPAPHPPPLCPTARNLLFAL